MRIMGLDVGSRTVGVAISDALGWALDVIPKLAEDKKQTLRAVLEQNLGLEKVMIQLNEWGFGPQVAMKIYQAYREETYRFYDHEDKYTLHDLGP